MIEYNSETANKLEELHPTIQAPVVLTYEELEAKLASMTTDRDFWMARTGEKVAIIETARTAIEETLAGDTDPASTFEDFREAFEALGVKGAREVEVRITATWRETVSVPIGHDLSEDDFEIDVRVNGDVEFVSWPGPDSVDIEEL
jgi:hypothetical protein